MADLPDPPVPADADLKDFTYTPMFRSRLFGSSFHARATDAEWRAGVTLWLKSQDQVPAGSLPNDDIDLCRLAEFGRDLKSWRKVKEMALHGWYLCSDGRLYHRVVAEVTNEQWLRKLRRKWATECARAKKQAQRRSAAIELPTFEEWLSQGQTVFVPGTSQECPKDNDQMSQGQMIDVPGTDDRCPGDTSVLSSGQGVDVPGEIGSNGREGNGIEEKRKEKSPLSGGQKETARRRQIPADWLPSPEGRAYAAERAHWPDERIASEAERFRDHHRGLGNRFADLDATWRTWVRNGAKFDAERGGRMSLNGIASDAYPTDSPEHWRDRLRLWVNPERGGPTRDRWLLHEAAWGPPPGDPGCRAPRDVLREFNLLGMAAE